MWAILLLTPFICRQTVGSPVLRPTPPPFSLTCVTHVNSLLSSVTGVLGRGELFKGLNCTEQSVKLNTGTQTLSVCVPQNATCTGRELTSDRDVCLLNILNDVSFYRTALVSHPHYDVFLSPVVKSAAQFMDCIPNTFVAHVTTISTSPEDTFYERLRLCRTLRGLHTRTVTIGRIIRHILNKDKNI